MPALRADHVTRFRPAAAADRTIRPLCIFAAQRRQFDVQIRCMKSAPAVLDMVFDALPLGLHGWNFERATAEFVGGKYWPIWRISRG